MATTIRPTPTWWSLVTAFTLIYREFTANYVIRITSPLALNKAGLFERWPLHQFQMKGVAFCAIDSSEALSPLAQYARFIGSHFPSTRCLCSSRISSAMLVLDRRTSSANGAFGRHERQDNAGMRLLRAASRCRSSVRRSIAFVVRQAGQHTQRNQ